MRFTLPALAALAAAALPNAATAQRHVTPEVVGTPFAERWPDAPYARNVWTMQVFDGRLFLGGGNSANGGPSPNAGPVPVISYDGRAFRTEFTVDEEQIIQFYPDGGTLLVPGHDSRDDWSFGNLYRRARGQWTKLRNLPHGIHVYGVRRFAGRLIAVGGAFSQPIDAWVSTDSATSWTSAALLPNPALAGPDNPSGQFERIVNPKDYGRFWTLFEIGGRLYASTSAPLIRPGSKGKPRYASLFQFDPARNGFEPLSFDPASSLFPGVAATGDRIALVERWAKIGNQTFYIGGWRHNDHQWLPVGLFAATSLKRARQLPLPEGEQPWDLLVQDDKLYCLSARKQADDTFAVTVTRFDHDMRKGVPVLTFTTPTFARSFVVYQGRFYFGLGTETDIGPKLSGAAGTVLSTPFLR